MCEDKYDFEVSEKCKWFLVRSEKDKNELNNHEEWKPLKGT